jgi:hypothetical protein
MSPDSNLIPVRRANDRVYYVGAAWLYVHRANFTFRYHGNGDVREAREIVRASLAPLSSDGAHFMQALENGRRVHALRGVRGSNN